MVDVDRHARAPRFRAVVLVDNGRSSVPGLQTEWGLSVFVEVGGVRVLLDFGQSDACVCNAERLGIDLGSVDAAVLSHAHYDHADGMEAFFEANERAPLYLSSACAENCWSTKGGTAERHYIGVRPGSLERFASRIVRVDTNVARELVPRVWVVPHASSGLVERGRREGMYVRTRAGFLPDCFDHELTVVCEAGVRPNDALVVLSSCSHAGLAAILSEVQVAFPHRPIASFVGGLHLLRASDQAILGAARALRAAGVAHVWAGHCTGEHALDLLGRELPGRVHELFPGATIELA